MLCNGNKYYIYYVLQQLTLILSFWFPQTTPNTSAIFAQGFPLVPFTTFSHQHQSSNQASTESSKPIGQQPPPPISTHPHSLSHYTEHLQNVRKFHEDLHSRLKVQQQGWTTAEKRVDIGRGSREVSSIGLDDRTQGPTAVSSSFLMTNLRYEREWSFFSFLAYHVFLSIGVFPKTMGSVQPSLTPLAKC